MPPHLRPGRCRCRSFAQQDELTPSSPGSKPPSANTRNLIHPASATACASHNGGTRACGEWRASECPADLETFPLRSACLLTLLLLLGHLRHVSQSAGGQQSERASMGGLKTSDERSGREGDGEGGEEREGERKVSSAQPPHSELRPPSSARLAAKNILEVAGKGEERRRRMQIERGGLTNVASHSLSLSSFFRD